MFEKTAVAFICYLGESYFVYRHYQRTEHIESELSFGTHSILALSFNAVMITACRLECASSLTFV